MENGDRMEIGMFHSHGDGDGDGDARANRPCGYVDVLNLEELQGDGKGQFY